MFTLGHRKKENIAIIKFPSHIKYYIESFLGFVQFDCISCKVTLSMTTLSGFKYKKIISPCILSVPFSMVLNYCLTLKNKELLTGQI